MVDDGDSEGVQPDAIPLDLMRARNETIAAQIAHINDRVAVTNVKADTVQANLATALLLA